MEIMFSKYQKVNNFCNFCLLSKLKSPIWQQNLTNRWQQQCDQMIRKNGPIKKSSQNSCQGKEMPKCKSPNFGDLIKVQQTMFSNYSFRQRHKKSALVKSSSKFYYFGGLLHLPEYHNEFSKVA
jgi:hypothetical protein